MEAIVGQTVLAAEGTEALGEGILIGSGGGRAARVVTLIALGQVGKLAGEVRKEAVPRCGAETEQVKVAMAEIAADMREGLLAHAIGTGREVMQQSMEADVPPVSRPRVRAVDGSGDTCSTIR